MWNNPICSSQAELLHCSGSLTGKLRSTAITFMPVQGSNVRLQASHLGMKLWGSLGISVFTVGTSNPLPWPSDCHGIHDPTCGNCGLIHGGYSSSDTSTLWDPSPASKHITQCHSLPPPWTTSHRQRQLCVWGGGAVPVISSLLVTGLSGAYATYRALCTIPALPSDYPVAFRLAQLSENL